MSHSYFEVRSRLMVEMPSACINDTVKEIMYGLFYRAVELTLVPTEERYIRIGQPDPVALTKGESVVSVSEKGVYIAAVDDRALLNGLLMLLRDVVAENLNVGTEELRIPVGTTYIAPTVSRRMVHFCMAPRISKEVYKKLFRLAAVLGYTHIVVEFWGTFPYEVMEELSWKDASFTKDEVAEILCEASALKVEVVPMINHFGHAPGCRMVFGKHVALDQNPRLATYFSPDGWWWNFERPEVRALLRKMRGELYEVFGKGTYFHLGFDEGFSYPHDNAADEALCRYLKELCAEIVEEGRVPLLWGDQLLHEPTVGINMAMGYEGNAPSAEMAEALLAALPKEAVVCDWQYFVKEAPWRSATYFKERAVNFMVCPWDDREGFATAIQTAAEYGCYGVLHTTWDRVFRGDGVRSLFHAHDVFFGRGEATKKVGNKLEDATLMRKIWFADGDYERAGWTKQDFYCDFSE